MARIGEEEACVTGLRLFKWNEKLNKNNVPRGECLFLFIIDETMVNLTSPQARFTMVSSIINKSKKMKVVSFKLGDLFRPSCYVGLVTEAIDAAMISQPVINSVLAAEIYGRVVACYRLTRGVFINGPPVVLVVEISRWLQYFENPVKILVEDTPSDLRICSNRDEILGLLYSHKSDSEDEDLYNYGSDYDFDDDFYADDMVDDEDHEDGDLATTEAEEYGYIVGVLRSWRGVERMSPLESLCDGIPAGLVLIESKLKIGTVPDGDEANDQECAICLDGFCKGTITVRMACGHDFHKKCIFNWLWNKQSCPLCRSSSLAFA